MEVKMKVMPSELKRSINKTTNMFIGEWYSCECDVPHHHTITDQVPVIVYTQRGYISSAIYRPSDDSFTPCYDTKDRAVAWAYPLKVPTLEIHDEEIWLELDYIGKMQIIDKYEEEEY